MTTVWMEAPLRITVRPASPSPTDGVVAVAAALALERVAPHARVELLDPQGAVDDVDGVVTPQPEALGVFAEPVDLDPLRAAATAGLGSRAVFEEDGAGQWYRADVDAGTDAMSVGDPSPWAFAGWWANSASFSGSTDRGKLLQAVAEGTGGPSLEDALRWATAEVDLVLSQVCARDPSRIRRWLTELSAEVTAMTRRLAVLEPPISGDSAGE